MRPMPHDWPSLPRVDREALTPSQRALVAALVSAIVKELQADPSLSSEGPPEHKMSPP